MRLLQVFLVVLPWPLRRWVFTTVYGARIDRSAYVGFSVILSENIELGEGARVGHFNLIKGLSLFRLEEFASIGHLNWISGYPYSKSQRFSSSNRVPSLEMGRHSTLTQCHRLDCSGAIVIGEFSVVAGYGTQVLTHAIDFERSQQEVQPVRLGAYTFVGTRSVLLPGSVLPQYSILAAGAVLVDAYQSEYYIYGGVPAKPIKKLNKDLAYFSRLSGHVH